VKGRHEIKTGGEWRENQINWYQVGVPEGTYIYDFDGTCQYPYGGTGGDAMASFLTGVGSPGT
jgi:hypothetical protein